MRNLDLAPDRPHHRRACLLRAWQEGDDSHDWRFSLQNIETGERRGFADFEGLLAGLRLWLEAGSAADRGDAARVPRGRSGAARHQPDRDFGPAGHGGLSADATPAAADAAGKSALEQ